MCYVVSNSNSRGRKSFFLLWKESVSQKQSKQTTKKISLLSISYPYLNPYPTNSALCGLGLKKKRRPQRAGV